MIEEIQERRPSRLPLLLLIALGCVVLGVFYIRQLVLPPESFTTMMRFEVQEGMTVREIAEAAERNGLVRSDLLLYAILTRSYDPTSIYAGEYVFMEPVDVFGVAQKIAANDIENNLVRVTIPEGVRLTQIAEIAAAVLPSFDVDEYLIATNELEGKLFPETYFVPEDFTATDLAQLQQETYEELIAPLRSEIESSGLTEWELVTLASIIEREANDEESMGMVAGILRNRLDIGMALQADATIEYVLDTPLGELPPGQLAAELRETDSPYNSYLNTGLPPTPIGNPGRMALTAALRPTESDYFFYITGNDGVFYYAETLAGHNRNIDLHLR